MSISIPADKDTKNAALDFKIRYNSPLIVNVQIICPVGLIIVLHKETNYLFFIGLEGVGTELRYLLNKAQVLGPIFPSTLRAFAF